VNQPLHLMCIWHFPRCSWWLVDVGIGKAGCVIWVVANQREIVATLECPLVESPLDILSSADFEQDCFLVLSVWDSGGEGVEYIRGSSLARYWS